MSRYSRDSWLGALPIVLYFSLAILYTLAIPVGESPDEPGHLQCVEQVARFQRLPEVRPEPRGEWYSREFLISGRMCYHMPLYYVLGGYVVLAAHNLSGDELPYEFPPSNLQRANSPAMFSHKGYEGMALLRNTQPSTMLSLRLLGIFLGAATVVASGKIAENLFPSTRLAGTAAATLTAGWPQLLFMARAITNDMLAVALVAIALVVITRNIGNPRRFVWSGLLVALAVATKLNMVAMVVALAAAFLVESVYFSTTRSRYLRAGAMLLLIFGVLAALLSFQPTLREHILFTAKSFGGIEDNALSPGYWLDVVHLTLSSGWAHFGWMNVPAPEWQAYAWWAFLVVGTVLGVRELLSDRGDGRVKRILGAVILLIWAGSLMIGYVRINLNRFQPQFRFIFGVVPIVTSLASAGYLQRLSGHRRWPVAFVLTSATLLFVANLWLLRYLVAPAYQ